MAFWAFRLTVPTVTTPAVLSTIWPVVAQVPADPRAAGAIEGGGPGAGGLRDVGRSPQRAGEGDVVGRRP